MDARYKDPAEAAARRGLAPILAGLLLTALPGAPPGVCQVVPDPGAGLTLSQFRGLIQARQASPSRQSPRSGEKSPPDFRLADQVFSQLLIAQAKEAAARQSLDRLSGWSKAIEARFQAQNAPALDLELVRFAEARVAAESAQFEAERRRALEQANSLLGRAADTSLVALLQTPAASATERVVPATPLNPLEKLEKELLPQGQELLAKLYQSYLFGGISLSILLWHEQEVCKTELQYRVWMARDAVDRSSAEAER